MTGTLVLIGGAEEKYNNDLFKKLIDLKETNNIVIIPSANKSDPVKAGNTYKKIFEELKVKNIHIADIRNKSEINDTELDKLNNADLVFISGGDQTYLSEIFNDTEYLNIIKDKYLNHNLTYAGTSAGAAIVSDTMIYDGDYKGFEKGSIHFEKGFGLTDIVVDTHYDERNRLARTSQFLLGSNYNKAIGICENTAIFIKDDIGEIFGEKEIIFINTETVYFNNYKDINVGEKIGTGGINIDYLPSGYKFSFKNWKIIY